MIPAAAAIIMSTTVIAAIIAAVVIGYPKHAGIAQMRFFPWRGLVHHIGPARKSTVG
jgi:hypothetical protein